MELFLLLLIVLMTVWMFQRRGSLSQRNKKNKALLELMSHVEKDDFLACEQAFKEKIKDDEFIQKATVLKLFWMSRTGNFEDWNETLEQLDVALLASHPKIMELNEDSFFHLCIKIPAYLKQQHQTEQLVQLEEKLCEVQEVCGGTRFYEIFKASLKNILKREDQGEAFYRQYLNYELQLTGFKKLKDLYHQITAVQYAALLKEKGASVAEVQNEVKQFSESYFGKIYCEQWDVLELGESDKKTEESEEIEA